MKKDTRAGLQFTSAGYLSLVLAPFRINWTVQYLILSLYTNNKKLRIGLSGIGTVHYNQMKNLGSILTWAFQPKIRKEYRYEPRIVSCSSAEDVQIQQTCETEQPTPHQFSSLNITQNFPENYCR
jgi:hypothetical protein